MRRLTGYLVMEERADAVETLEHPGAQIKVLPASSGLALQPSRVSAVNMLLPWCLALSHLYMLAAAASLHQHHCTSSLAAMPSVS